MGEPVRKQFTQFPSREALAKELEAAPTRYRHRSGQAATMELMQENDELLRLERNRLASTAMSKDPSLTPQQQAANDKDELHKDENDQLLDELHRARAHAEVVATDKKRNRRAKRKALTKAAFCKSDPLEPTETAAANQQEEGSPAKKKFLCAFDPPCDPSHPEALCDNAG